MSDVQPGARDISIFWPLLLITISLSLLLLQPLLVVVVSVGLIIRAVET